MGVSNASVCLLWMMSMCPMSMSIASIGMVAWSLCQSSQPALDHHRLLLLPQLSECNTAVQSLTPFCTTDVTMTTAGTTPLHILP